MSRENLAFLLGGLAFGVLLGFGLFHTFANRPQAQQAQFLAGEASIPRPAGPMAPTEAGPDPGARSSGGSGAPMMEEISQLKKAVQENPQNVEALMRLGSLYREVGMWSQAAEFYGKAAGVRPTDLSLLVEIAHTYHDGELWPQASEAYERALAVKPEDPDLLTDLGICYKGMKQFEKSLETFRHAQSAEPSHWQSLYNIVVVTAFDLRRFDEAEEALRRLEKLNPSAPHLSELRQALTQARAAKPSEGRS